VTQALTISATALLLLRLSRGFGAAGWVAAIIPLLWLVSPVVVRANLWDFHPDALIAALLVATALAAISQRPAIALLLAALGCSFKEDAGLTFAALGLALAWNRHRRLGFVLAAGAGAWALVLNGVLLPAVWPATREHYTSRFVGDRADGFGSVVRVWIEHPLATVTDALTPTTIGILALLLAMTGGLCLRAKRWLVVALPSVALNLLSAYEGQHTLRYQYWLVPAAAVAIAGAAGAAALSPARARIATRVGLASACGLAILSAVALGRVVADIHQEWPARAHRQAIVDAVPHDASVSAPLRYLSHLASRRDVYTFPDPFAGVAPGFEATPEEVARRRAGVEYVIFDPLATRNPEALEEVRADGFRAVFRAGTATVYRGPRPPGE
jgi:uncharacterized membrane protein